MSESLNNPTPQFTAFHERTFCVLAVVVLLFSIRGMVQLLQFSVSSAAVMVEMPPLPSEGGGLAMNAATYPVADAAAVANPFHVSFPITPPPPVVVVKQDPPKPPPKKVEPKREPPKRVIALTFRGVRSNLKRDVMYVKLDIQDSVEGNSVAWLPMNYSYRGLFTITAISPDAITVRAADGKSHAIRFNGKTTLTLAQ